MTAATGSPRKSPKKSSKKGKGMKSPAAHPRTADMVTEAINALKDRKGSSLSAIKKYIAAHYKLDAARLAPFIRMAVKKGVAAGTYKQVSGTGASGKFRMNSKPVVGKKGKATTPKKAKKEKKHKAQKKAKKPKAHKTEQKPKKAVKQQKKAKKQKKTKKGGKKSKKGKK